MATTSFQTSSLGYNSHGKSSKSRARTSVKPILKKLHSHSHSEKNSLDLDRGWQDQEPSLGYVVTPDDFSHPTKRYYDATDGLFSSTSSLSAADSFGVSFSLSANDLGPKGLLGAPPSGGSSRVISSPSSSAAVASATSSSPSSSSAPSRAFAHARSTSGASHASIATSNSRNGSFIHPFQQNPQTSTPPLHSYTNSRPSFDTARDYSPTIAEDEDDEDEDDVAATPGRLSYGRTSYDLGGISYNDATADGLASPDLATANTSTTSVSRFASRPTLSPSHRSASYVRPSLAHSRRSGSGSLTDTIPVPAGNQGRLSDNQLGTSLTVTIVDDGWDASTLPFAGAGGDPPSNGDVDTSNRQEQVRQARRKFEEKERAKEEKYAREKERKRERASTRESLGHHSRMGSFTNGDAMRPQLSRRSTAHSRALTEHASISQREMAGYDDDGDGHEDDCFAGTSAAAALDSHDSYERANNGAGSPPQTVRRRRTDEHRRARTTAAKHKTTGAWTAFALWFRTRLLKLGRR
ncbi:hypothetical protein GMORB2_3903 [Geosmithia morbida]|uniref:Uncharacterized protein n=1 Tax=Geosmithia morbida TaxID=1094350 RepID=A0A9P4Z0A9_9HYPO|nr:uncharacterized protein GMORB2_3903 [Geosmithia morbida]KAF4125064.1 hypothetical protein GMORB2_3903 [Geosmithia morbida]